MLQSGLQRLLQGDLRQAVLLATEAASLDCDETVRKIAAFILRCGGEASGHSAPQGTAPKSAEGNPSHPPSGEAAGNVTEKPRLWG